MKPSNLRNPLSTARGLGSAKDGTSHWFMQRVTAVMLAPLMMWLLYSLLTHVLGGDRASVAEWFVSPYVTVTMLILVTAMFYHMKLGLQVVIEDYIHKECFKMFAIFKLYIGTFILLIVSWMAILRLHLYSL